MFYLFILSTHIFYSSLLCINNFQKKKKNLTQFYLKILQICKSINLVHNYIKTFIFKKIAKKY